MRRWAAVRRRPRQTCGAVSRVQYLFSALATYIHYHVGLVNHCANHRAAARVRGNAGLVTSCAPPAWLDRHGCMGAPVAVCLLRFALHRPLIVPTHQLRQQRHCRLWVLAENAAERAGSGGAPRGEWWDRHRGRVGSPAPAHRPDRPLSPRRRCSSSSGALPMQRWPPRPPSGTSWASW